MTLPAMISAASLVPRLPIKTRSQPFQITIYPRPPANSQPCPIPEHLRNPMSVPIPWRAQPLIPAKKNGTDHNLDPSPSPKRRHSPCAAQPNPTVIPKWPAYSADQAHPASPSRKSKEYIITSGYQLFEHPIRKQSKDLARTPSHSNVSLCTYN